MDNSSGSKATLITRVTQDDKRLASEALAEPSHPSVMQAQSRGVSASAHSPAEPIAGPGSSHAGYSLDVKIPKASKREQETPIAIV